MSNKDGFASGLIVGTALGSIFGAIVGVLLTDRANKTTDSEPNKLKPSEKKAKLTAEKMEKARLSLEDKIAQLNQAIEDVRLQIGTVPPNGTQENQSQLSDD